MTARDALAEVHRLAAEALLNPPAPKMADTGVLVEICTLCERACADDLETAPSPQKVHEDEEVTRGGTSEMLGVLQSSASQGGVVSAPVPNHAKALTPRERAEKALTILSHETGTATIHLSGLTLTDVYVDLGQRLADAIADAEEDVTRDWADRVSAGHQRERQLLAIIQATPDGVGAPLVADSAQILSSERSTSDRPREDASSSLPPGVSYMICALCSHTKWSDRECLSCFGLGPVNASSKGKDEENSTAAEVVTGGAAAVETSTSARVASGHSAVDRRGEPLDAHHGEGLGDHRQVAAAAVTVPPSAPAPYSSEIFADVVKGAMERGIDVPKIIADELRKNASAAAVARSAPGAEK